MIALFALPLVAYLAWLLARMTFRDKKGVCHCPRWLPIAWHIRWLVWTEPLRKLPDAIRIGWIFLVTPGLVEVILAPEDAWEVLDQSLWLDARSHAADKETRDEVAAALGKLIHL